MEKESFSQMLQELVLPMFAGATIMGETESSPRDFEVAQGAGGSVLVKPEKKDEYRFIIKRGQPFQSTDIALIKEIVLELVKISKIESLDNTYKKKLQSIAIEKAICSSLCEESAETMLGLIEELLIWSTKTYEGNGTDFGFMINGSAQSKTTDKNLHYSHFIRSDFAALLSDGIMSYLELDQDGYLIGHNMMTNTRAMQISAPYQYSSFARASIGKKIGITLSKEGDLLVFKDSELVVSKRRGVWNVFSHSEIVGMLSSKKQHSMKEIRKSVYFSALDTAFASSGGCIAILNAGQIENAVKHIDLYDILDERYYEIKKKQILDEHNQTKISDTTMAVLREANHSFDDFLKISRCVKIANLIRIINRRRFHELDRKLRQELIGMDGATVIDADGRIIAVGAIVQIEAGSAGGGRLAATKTLSRYGVAIKISTDGFMQGYAYDKKHNEYKNIFSVG